MLKRSAIVLLHIAYWLMYLALISIFLAATWNPTGGRSLPGLLTILFFSALFPGVILPGVLGFYCFYSLLFTRLLQRKKFARLALAAVVAALVISLCCIAMLTITSMPSKSYSSGEMTAMILSLSVIALIHGIVALVMRGFISWYGDIRLKEQLNKKNYEMELALVKSQINPHFLFNTLNNIDELIRKDPERASGYLNKLSDIMRFMLYETKTEKIPLEKELAYIGKYIDLQRIRTANPRYVSYEVEGEAAGIMIEPMLFIPFIENAFKHAEDKKIDQAIKVRFGIDGQTITFDCENRYNPLSVDRPDHAGLGNGLIRKRLLLLYPGKHTLDVDTNGGRYRAKLILHGYAD